MGWFGKFIFVVGVIISIILFMFDFSDTIEVILISIVAGIIIFVIFTLISGLRHANRVIGMKKDKFFIERIKKKNRRNRIIGFIILVVSIVLFLNSYLYIKALMGNDMRVSLKIDKENFVIKNGEAEQFNLKAKVLTNPFCQADCSIALEDLGKGENLFYEKAYIQVSAPYSKDYALYSNSEKFGQNLYKISLECNTIKSKLCYTANKISKSRTKIISVDYELNDIQKTRKEELKNEIESLNKESYTIKNGLNNLNFNLSYLDLSEFWSEYQYLNNLSDFFLNNLSSLNTLYENQEYNELEAEVLKAKNNVENISNRFNEFNSSIMQNINFYNSLVDNLTLMYYNISYLEDANFSDSSILKVQSFIEDFNSAISEFWRYNEIGRKIILFNQLESEKENLFSVLKNESENTTKENPLNMSIFPVNLSKILIQNEENNFTFILNEPSPVCCLKNECYKCIDDSSLNYPVILVHGHSFNEKLSAELSMESFNEMARKMEKEGYINAGYFYGSQYDGISKGYLGKVNNSIVVEATYYLDTLVTEEGSFIFDSKGESIDTYSFRLNEIVSNVKYITGKDKVIIIAHSMGGLVTRKYVQLYGDGNLDKLIFVGIPNKGIDGYVLASCPVFGADIECSEMNKSSSFMTELNKVSPLNISVYNIIGTGCLIEGSEGDGIVKSESAYLEGAENMYVNGTCKGVDFFHTRMIKPSKHPEIYDIIKNLIEK